MPTFVHCPHNPETFPPSAWRRFPHPLLLISLVLLAIAIFPACHASAQSHPVVTPGYSTAQVLSLMGRPILRQSRGLNEAWQYKRTKANYDGDEYLVVWFHRGVVRHVTTYTNDVDFNGNTANYEMIRWEDAPKDL
ncbi:MAG: hypothetical protein KA257_01145 [Opitutaceae bacterium]|nr:hypothetical protein [Opitutaceae bacterium]MBP9912126.1 hypothetical protein [Opitutaceae bacterium]